MGDSKVMDLEKTDFSSEGRGAAVATACSICLELVLDQGRRSTARLQCGHEFHLDCIGSAFNAKGAMQCPNCRKVEKGRWLYANGNRSSAELDIDGWVTEDIYDVSYSELPFGFQWLPLRGFTQLASLFDEADSMPNSYHEFMSNSMFRDHSNSSSSSHICPYLALHSFPNAMRAAPLSSADSLPDNGLFHQHTSSLAGQSSSDMMNSHSFPVTEPQNHNWQQQHSLSFPLLQNPDQSASQYGVRMSRNDSSSQHRLGGFVHPHPLMHGSVARNGSNLVGSLGPPVTGEVRGHNGGLGSHLYQPSIYSSSHRSSPFTPVRRMRPRGLTLVSSVAAPSSAEIGGFYGFSVSGSVNRSQQEGDSIGRHVDRFYGWGREGGVGPLPWIPIEGESHWWSPFNPNQNPQQGGFTQRPAADGRAAQNCPENGYQHMPPPRLPPFM